jgi:hypothetical protein
MNLALVLIFGKQSSSTLPEAARQTAAALADLRPAGAEEHFRSIWHLDHHDLQDGMNSVFRKEKTTPRVGGEPSDHPGVPLRRNAGKATPKGKGRRHRNPVWTYAVNRQPAQPSAKLIGLTNR